MDFIECIEFANNNTLCYLATTERRQPHVKAFRMWFADEKGFHFITLSGKSVCKQLKDYPQVEVCFFNNKTGENNLAIHFGQ